jgi:hypothetical protein
MHEPDWIVLRFSPKLPREMVSEELDGQWFDRAELGGKVESRRVANATATRVQSSVARPTGRFEIDEDRMIVAEVWEVDIPAAA